MSHCKIIMTLWICNKWNQEQELIKLELLDGGMFLEVNCETDDCLTFFSLGQDIWLEEQERGQAAEVHQERYSASQIWTAKCQTG